VEVSEKLSLHPKVCNATFGIVPDILKMIE